MNSRVSIVILNWNGWRDTIECLESLYEISYPNYDVILIDNGSENCSLDEIRAYLDGKKVVESKFFKYSLKNKPIKVLEYTTAKAELGGGREDEIADLPPKNRLILIKNDKNYGFAEGCNIGIRYALKSLNPYYILLLNNDTVVDKDFLTELVMVAEADEKNGFIGPKTYYYNYNGRSDVISVAGIELQMSRGSYRRTGQSEPDVGQYDEVRVVDYLEGSCLLIKRNVLDRIGLFNIKYFAYWEETDLCTRGMKTGYKSVYAPRSKIWHKVSASSIGTTKLYFMTRNRLWFLREHAAGGEFASFLLYFFAYQFWLVAGMYLRRRDFEKLSSFLKGVQDGFLSAE
jgi:GT2 family glycosyltransferase